MTEAADVPTALQDWMQAHVPGFCGALRMHAFEGGQSNPTFRLSAGSGEYVLRRRPMGKLLPSAHAVDREYRVIRALTGTGVPVPGVYGYCGDDSVIGSTFYVMDYVPGRIFFDPRLPDQPPAERRAMFGSMNDVIAALHSVDWRAAGLEGFGRPGGFLARQIARWTSQYRASEMQPIEAMDRLIAWLPAHLPAADEVSLVHGDYRMDNLLFHPSEPRVVAVLDWELATIGDPLADFGCHVSTWRIAPELFRGLAGSDLRRLGIPGEAEYVADYCRKTGRTAIADWEYYLVFGMFRLAAILQGIRKRAAEGTAASQQAIDIGNRAPGVAAEAWALAGRIG
ncbi:MAG TPA: phosphotransferase family protein [Acetobacteraceae bacterium]